MSHLIVAEFETALAMTDAARMANAQGRAARDALSPYPVPDVLPHLAKGPKRPVGWVMVLAGAIGALGFWLVQSYSATIDYPFISGNRPFFSWQIFVIVSYEALILFASVAGFVAFVRGCRMPSLYHPLFEISAVERASQDRFFLIFEADEEERAAMSLSVANLKPLTTNEVAL